MKLKMRLLLFYHYPGTAVTKTYIEVHSNVSPIAWHVLPEYTSDSTVTACHVRDLLWVLNLPTKQCVHSVSAHRLRASVSHFRLWFWNDRHHIFISPDMWLQHRDLNPLTYKMCIKIQQRPSEKIHNVNWTTLYGMAGMALSNTSSITVQKSGENVSECVHVVMYTLFA